MPVSAISRSQYYTMKATPVQNWVCLHSKASTDLGIFRHQALTEAGAAVVKNDFEGAWALVARAKDHYRAANGRS
eukprot:2803734-Rhodomonas_salina.1